MKSLIKESVEMVANVRVTVNRTETWQRARHRLDLTPCVMQLALTRVKFSQTDITLLCIRLSELERRPRHVPCHNYNSTSVDGITTNIR